MIHIDRNWLLERGACPEGIASFEAFFPDGLDYNPHSHECAARIAASPCYIWLRWAISAGLPPQALIAGDYGTATAGAYGTAVVGLGGDATAGYFGIAKAGGHGTATAGYGGDAAAGDYGIAKAGDHGIATVGQGGTAKAGDHGTATSGLGGTVSAGVGGILQCRWHDGQRYRVAVAYVGEDGIRPDTPYTTYQDEAGRWVRA